jgi:hypothetical protein
VKVGFQSKGSIKMAKKVLFCEECEKEFTITFKTEDGEPNHCPFCATELDLDWNSAEAEEECS